MTALPVLDLTAFRTDPASPAAAELVDALREICHEVSFFYLAGHGISPALEEAVVAQSLAFFDLPEADRLSVENVRSPAFRGYTRTGGEYTAGRPDRRDQLDIGPEDPEPELAEGDPAWLRMRGPNLWPAALPGLRAAVEPWVAQMQTTGTTLMRALALALGQPAEFFAPIVDPRPDFRLKIIRYPATEQAPGGTDDGADDGAHRQGVGAHRDTGFMSMILQDDVGGLEVERDGTWVDVPRVPGTYVVNLGEMVQLLTHGYFRAAVHRVLSPPPGVDRLSVAYFHNPALHATLTPVDLPPHLAALAPGGASTDPSNPILASFGLNTLKVRLRSHPDVAARWHADLLGR
ncbi:isopenicillin N synthase family oxygenase [Kineosporia sp. R_H_3]|uniref:isopenicillin N synthase family dioxygenase n=1 Tax=Kineosporia sp. R_H_3 TaxID=1961848 RepID=UPI000B4B9A1F|nr:2-oxoglutarate and iron-dependent oxygenase domain-containing protein [Kineosporia sp. R_H_3]